MTRRHHIGGIDWTPERQRARLRRARYLRRHLYVRPPLMGERGNTNGPALMAFLRRVTKLSELAGPPRTRRWYRCTRSSKAGQRCASSWPHKGRAPGRRHLIVFLRWVSEGVGSGILGPKRERVITGLTFTGLLAHKVRLPGRSAVLKLLGFNAPSLRIPWPRNGVSQRPTSNQSTPAIRTRAGQTDHFIR